MIVHRRGRVEIFDTDASGLIYFGATARWMADAEQDLLDAIGMSFDMVNVSDDAGQAGPSAPTRSYEVSIDARLGYLDEFDHELWVSRVGRSSYTVSHRITRDGVVCARGEVHRVYVDVQPGVGMVPVDVPAAIRNAVTDGEGPAVARDRGPGRFVDVVDGPIVARKDRVAIYDTDASGLIFYGSPTRWVSVGDAELLRAIGLELPKLRDGMATGAAAAPIRHYRVDIDAPMWFRDEYEHRTWIGYVGTTSYTTDHEFRVGDKVCVRAALLHVNVEVRDDGSMTSVALPEVLGQARSSGPGEDR